jgi:hypothetical protein
MTILVSPIACKQQNPKGLRPGKREGVPPQFAETKGGATNRSPGAQHQPESVDTPWMASSFTRSFAWPIETHHRGDGLICIGCGDAALPRLLDETVDGDASALIASGAHRKPWGDLILPLNHLALRGRDVAGEGHEEVSGDPLLDGNVGAGRTLITGP